MKSVVKYSLGIAVCSVLFLQACKKDDNPDTGDTTTSGMATFHAEFQCTGVEDHEDLVLNETYVNPNGDSVSFSEVRYWLSNIELVREDGSVWTEKNSYRLIERSAANKREEFMFDIPTGKYKAIRFGIGVDKDRNSSIDSIQGELDVNKGMSWTWNTGYIFFKTEGNYYNSDSMSQEPWKYHIGMDANYQTIELAFPATINVESGKEVHMHTVLRILSLFSAPNKMSLKDFPVLMMGPVDQTLNASENFSKLFELHHVMID